jgi:hypothetical protein
MIEEPGEARVKKIPEDLRKERSAKSVDDRLVEELRAAGLMWGLTKRIVELNDRKCGI